MKTYGAYLHCKPDGTPFYVGKGDVKRMRDLYTGRNKHHKHITKKYGNANILKGFMECSNEETALELEIGLIKCLRRMGIELANYTDGGDNGSKGYKWTKEQREKASKVHTGKVLAKEHKENISKALIGLKRPSRTEQHKRKLGDAMKGRKWYNNGTNVVLCYEGNQPEGYVLGRGSTKFTSVKGGNLVKN